MREFLIGASILTAYIVISIVAAVAVQRLSGISSEALRKTLHFILLGAYIPLTLGFSVWWHAAIFACLLLALTYPFLLIVNRVPLLSGLLVERWRGEYLSSMMMALCTMTLVTCICWGGFGDRYLLIASVYAWGIGDGVAALVGRRFGRHKISFAFADPHKSVEGSLAMLTASVVSVFAVLLMRGGMPFAVCLFISLVAGCAVTLCEMCARNGFDTVLCPIASMAIILPLVSFFSGR